MEFSKLTQAEEDAIIAKYAIDSQTSLEIQKARYKAKEQLSSITDYLKDASNTKAEEKLVSEQLAKLSAFIKTNESLGYEKGLQEIRDYKWFQWDLYYITASFLMLSLFIFLSHDGDKYYYYGDLTQPLMFGSVLFAFKAAILWGINDLLSNIMTRSERVFKNEILIGVIVLYTLFVVVTVWEDVKRLIQKRREKISESTN